MEDPASINTSGPCVVADADGGAGVVDAGAGVVDAGAAVEAGVADEEGEGAAARVGWWQWLLWAGGWALLVMQFVDSIMWLDSSISLPPCFGNNIGAGTMPLTPGQCIEWDGGSRGFMRLLPGVKTKSRLTVTHGGGIYLGPDGVEIPIGDIMLESQTGGGLLCDAEKIVRKAAGVSPFFTARTSRSRLVFGAGIFCTSYSTPPPPSLFDELRQGEARFSDTGDLEVVGRRGMVVWSAAADSVVGAGGCSDRNAGEKDRLSNAAAEVEGWEILAGD